MAAVKKAKACESPKIFWAPQQVGEPLAVDEVASYFISDFTETFVSYTSSVTCDKSLRDSFPSRGSLDTNGKRRCKMHRLFNKIGMFFFFAIKGTAYGITNQKKTAAFVGDDAHIVPFYYRKR